MTTRWRTIAAAGWMLAWLWTGAAAGQTTLKLATLAPDGSIWMQALSDAKKEIELATGGAVKVKIYPGGIMGSEKDVLFKIKTGQLQGGGFMGYAIAKICPEVNALMFPMVFRNYGEVDGVLAKMRSFLDESARKNGYETMGWTEVGFSYAYSVKPIGSLDALRATKVWGLDAPMLIELCTAAGISYIPANITDVLTALQTGLLETVFGPPTATIAVQWHTKLRYYNSVRLTYAIGGVFVSTAGWSQVPPAQREAVANAIDRHCRLLSPKVRKSDNEALEYLQAQGVSASAETPELRAVFEQVAATALLKVKGAVFSAEAWDLLQQYLREIRGS